MLKSLVKKLPPFARLIEERDALVRAHGIAPPGHFYSPVVSISEATADAGRLFDAFPSVIRGIDLNEVEQLSILSDFEAMYASIPFCASKTPGLRYHYDNPTYSYSDAISLHCMIRRAKPTRIVEVGSGYSSCVSLDTNERFCGNRIEVTLIEPFPDLVKSLLTEADAKTVRLRPHRLQDVDLSVFDALSANDILFVDSTHVSKTGSDVNHLFFEILPRLASGVLVHLHDIFFPFEYPRDWVLGGRSWNEIYLLRAFLQYNNAFRIVFMNTFLEHFHESRFADRMPLCLKNRGGSIWLCRN